MSKPVQAVESASVISAGVAGDAKSHTNLASDGISDSIRRLGSTSAAQIDRLIAELTQLRDRLQSEGERVKREVERVQNQMAGYVETNDAVMESVKGISQTLAQFKGAAGLSQPH